MKIKHLSILTTLLGTILSLPAASILDLGDLGGPSSEGAAYGISADGSVVVGDSTATNDMSVAFRWTQANGIKGLDESPWGIVSSLAFGVSGDGQVVVGFGRTAGGRRAFRWTAAAGMVDLAGTSSPSNSTALAASSNGAVIVGNAMWADITTAFRWTAGSGMVSLGDFPGGETDSGAVGVSADGAVVVGAGTTSNGNEAFRWTATNGLESLGDLPGGNVDSWANAVSADGQVIVGGSSATNGYEAFRWTRSTGLVSLGTLPGFADFEATAVSADGKTVVGFCFPNNGSQDLVAFVWTPAGGLQKLADVLAARGVDLSQWQSLWQAYGVSADGRWVCGYGKTTNSIESKPFLADLASVITLQPVDDSTIGTRYPTNTANNAQLVLEYWVSGYTHRPLLKFDLSSIPNGCAVLSAELTLLHNLWHPNSAPVFHTEIWRMPDDNWSEETVTWGNYDQTGGVAVAMRQSTGWTNWNVLEPWVWNIRIADWNYAQDLLDDAVTFETRWKGGDNFWLFTGFSSKEGTAPPALKIAYLPQPSDPPRLSITLNPQLSTLGVSWPAPAEGWVLEGTNALPSVAVASWPQVQLPYQTNAGIISVTFTNTPATGNQFFRLHRP